MSSIWLLTFSLELAVANEVVTLEQLTTLHGMFIENFGANAPSEEPTSIEQYYNVLITWFTGGGGTEANVPFGLETSGFQMKLSLFQNKRLEMLKKLKI